MTPQEVLAHLHNVMTPSEYFVIPIAPVARAYEAMALAIRDAHAAGEISDEATLNAARGLREAFDHLVAGTHRPGEASTPVDG